MIDSTARMIGTVGIWASFAITMAFGVCKMNFSNPFPFLFAVALICASAVAATALVWKGLDHSPAAVSR